MNSKQLVQKLIPAWNGRLAAHDICYNGNGQVHRAIPYDPTNPAVALQKAQLMQVDGVDICIGTWQGPEAASCHAAAIAMSNACKQVGLQFALLLDPWCAKLSPTGTNTNYTANVTAALQNAGTQGMLKSSSYVPEGWVLDFNTGADLATLAKTFPTLTFLAQGSGFSWISIPTVTDSVARNVAAVANIKTQHANATMKVASFCASFNDAGQPLPVGVSTQAAFEKAGGQRNYANSTWGGPARVLESFAGQFAQQQLATINPATPAIAILSWADYDEQSSGPREKVKAEEEGIVWA
jgi:hypothetical protein